jgi:hypothetical protein
MTFCGAFTPQKFDAKVIGISKNPNRSPAFSPGWTHFGVYFLKKH